MFFPESNTDQQRVCRGYLSFSHTPPQVPRWVPATQEERLQTVWVGMVCEVAMSGISLQEKLFLPAEVRLILLSSFSFPMG